MPDIVTHYRFGDAALKALPEKCVLPLQRAVFDTATAGPDTWFFKDFWQHLSPNPIANRMHVEGGARLLEMLLEEARKDSTARDELYSFVLGFLCHYTIDHHAHAYINARTKGIRGGHMLLERCIDWASLSEWKEKRFLCITRQIFRLKKVGNMKNAMDKAYQSIYGIQNAAEEMDRCIRNQRIFYLVAQDPTGLLNAVLKAADKGKGETDLTTVSYHGKQNAVSDPLNLSRKHYPKTFPELWEEAMQEVLPKLEKVYACLYENQPIPALGELIG